VQLNEAAFNERQWRAVTSTSMGEIGVRGVLLAGVPARDAARAAAGWGGDRAYLFEREGDASLFVWKSAWDKHTDAEEFYRAYNAAQDRRKSAQATTNGESQMLWREDGHATLVYLNGDTVIILRGAEADLNTALEAALR